MPTAVVYGLCGDGAEGGPLTVDDARQAMIDAIGEFSELHYAAGWLIGIEEIIRRHGRQWVLLAWLAGGWPQGLDGEDGWAPLTPAENDLARAYVSGLLQSQRG